MEQLEPYIQQNYSFSKLPQHVRQSLGNARGEWDRVVLEYSLSHQLRWRRGIVRKVVPDETKYYQALLQYSTDHLMMYPYHLADVMVQKLQVTPYDYYFDILSTMLRNDRSYDSLPNFTAADCLQLMGIGRNEYIDIMNRSKTGKGIFRKRVAPKLLLPAEPRVPSKMEPWWIVNVGLVPEAAVRSILPLERMTLDKLIDSGRSPAGVIDRGALESLYKKQFLYLDAPVDDTDLIKVPPLEGFVMNRVLGDYLETLLYKIFVSIDEHTTVAELANILRIDLQQTKDAISIYLRLGFAFKKSVPSSELWHPSWQSRSAPVEAATTAAASATSPVVNALTMEEPRARSGQASRLAFLFDSTLTAFLMMGNLSPGLKKHAVTMFEAGKLSDEALGEFLRELEGTELLTEGQTQEYTRHAIVLRNALRFLRYHAALWDPAIAAGEIGSERGVDLVRCESLQALDPATRMRVLQRNYAVLVSMSPMGRDVHALSSVNPPHVGPAIAELTSAWFKLYLYVLLKQGPPSILFPAGARVTRLPDLLLDYETVVMAPWSQEPVVVQVTSLLTALNDALCHSPVLVQAAATRGATTETFHVPFTDVAPLVAAYDDGQPDLPSPTATETPKPADDSYDDGAHTLSLLATGGAETASSSTSSPTQPEDSPQQLASARQAMEHVLRTSQGRHWLRQCAELQTHPAVAQLRSLLHLDAALGYFTMQRQAPNGSWLVVDISWGMPLFDEHLNAALCLCAEKCAVFSVDNRAALVAAQRRLTLRLLDFIVMHGGLASELPSVTSREGSGKQVPYPTKALQFHNGGVEDLQF